MIQPQPPVSVPWTVRDVTWGLIAFGAWLFAFLALRLVIDRLMPDADLGLIVSLGELLLIVPVWWLTLRKHQVGWRDLGLRGFGTGAVGVGCGLMLASFTFNLIYSLILAYFDLRIQIDLVPIFEQLSSPWFFFIGGALIAPVVEEIFFRGFVFAGLRGRFGWQRAALISALLFALLHLSFTSVLPIFILGLIFAYLYHLSGSIWPAILMHMLTNSLALGAAYVVANAEAWGIPLS